MELATHLVTLLARPLRLKSSNSGVASLRLDPPLMQASKINKELLITRRAISPGSSNLSLGRSRREAKAIRNLSCTVYILTVQVLTLI
jgi:hypothetical protein